MYSTTTATLTAEQLKAIQEWAKVHGRTWKSKLRQAWMTGDYDGIEKYGNTAAYLQQVRNTFGPSWLVRFILLLDEGGRTYQAMKAELLAECAKDYGANNTTNTGEDGFLPALS